MTVLAAFPDAEAVGMALLDPVAPGQVWQTTPEQIAVPLIQVLRVGGTDNGITDAPLLFVACYGVGEGGYDEAKGMAEQCRQIILAAGSTAVVVNGLPVFIDSTRTAAPPVETPRDNPDLRRKTATYRLTYRRPF